MSGSVTQRLLATRFGIWHIFLFALIYGLVTKKRKLLKDWVPLLLLWVTYDMMRGLADDFRTINIKNVYDFEKFLFGWMFGGRNPTEWAQGHQNTALTIFYSIMYAMHPFTPLVVAALIYYKSKDTEMFQEFKYAFLLTAYSALITFALFPVAPPWYVWNNGNGNNFSQPEKLTGVRESAANLVEFDKFFDTNVFGDFYATFNANPYAAVPSLHAAFSFFAAYYFIRKYADAYGKKTYLAIIYPMLIWSGAVYLNHHYIVDLLAGMIYSYTWIRIVRFLRARSARKNKKKEGMVADTDISQEDIEQKHEDQTVVGKIELKPKIIQNE